MRYNYILKGTYAEHNFTFTSWALPAAVTVKSNEMKQRLLQTLLCKNGRGRLKGKKYCKSSMSDGRKIIHLI